LRRSGRSERSALSIDEVPRNGTPYAGSSTKVLEKCGPL
jgi:hypothetical protein